MDNISICISFIAGILGIGYPILLDVISRLDEKYSSQVIIDLFNRGKGKRTFIFLLKLALLLILVWLLRLPRLIDIPIINSYLNRSAEYLLIACTILLIIFFLLLVDKIFMYYTPTRFLPYLIKRHKEKPEQNEYEFFRAIADLLYFSIKNKNEKIATTISDFLYEAFKDIRDIGANTEVVYPTIYYQTVSKTIEELASQDNKRLSFLEHRTAGSVWLLGELGSSKISENTYSWMWSNIQEALESQRDDLIIYHWEHAHQYFSMNLKHIPQQYNDKFDVTNKEEIDKRIEERRRFLEFHHALGGLLLYRQRYDCLARAFTYTQSIPPRYELLPYSMSEVFGIFFHFWDPYEMKMPWISHRYWFPKLSGLNSDATVKKLIGKYVALLFIRQYSIHPYLEYMKPLERPAIPTKQVEKRQWIDNLGYFKGFVSEILIDKELLVTVGLDFVTDDWCAANKKPKPLTFVEEVKQAVVESFDDALVEQSISAEKAQKFKDTSKLLLKSVLREYDKLNNQSPLNAELKKWYINGYSHIIDKSGFAEDQDVHHVEFDSFIAEGLVRKIQNGVSEIFALAASKSYLLNAQDVTQAINNLKINATDYTIVCFGDVEGAIFKNTSNQINVIAFEFGNYALVGDSIFILKKTDLPKLLFKELNEDVIKRYSWEVIDNDHKLYAALVDLNKSSELRDEFAEFSKERDLKKSVFVGLSMNLEVQWNENVHCIQIRIASPYREQGIINKLADIVPVDQ